MTIDAAAPLVLIGVTVALFLGLWWWRHAVPSPPRSAGVDWLVRAHREEKAQRRREEQARRAFVDAVAEGVKKGLGR